jgi:hypothetical protein
VASHSLQKVGQGLDDVRPFSYTEAVENLMRDAEMMFLPESSSVGPKNASRIWAFLSKFVMLDRFAASFGLAEPHRGIPLTRQTLFRHEFGAGIKVGISVWITPFV